VSDHFRELNHGKKFINSRFLVNRIFTGRLGNTSDKIQTRNVLFP
jgi:hypothetical protein